MTYADPRVPNPPEDIRKNFGYDALWRTGYLACLADMDAGKFDRPTRAEVAEAAQYGYSVENYFNGHEYPSNSFVVVDYEGIVHGPAHDTRIAAETDAVARWKEETRFT